MTAAELYADVRSDGAVTVEDPSPEAACVAYTPSPDPNAETTI